MFSLNPEKLFIVLIVALVLLGPDKLPKLARQLGAGWTKVRAFQQRMEAEVRESMPDLPSSHEIARIVRSPVSYLNSMADLDSTLVPDPAAPGPSREASAEFPLDPAAPAPSTNGHAPAPPLVRPVAVPGPHLPADPGMN
jgi:sec-independent protein translocase protein TatB